MNMITSAARENYPTAALYDKQERQLSAKQFKRWQDCIERRCGLYFDESRIPFLYNALLERMAIHGFTDYDEYLRILLYGNNAEREWKELYCRLVNCETSFFRHQPSYEVLKEYIFPELLESRNNDLFKLISIWSVGCSCGQETYSIALSAIDSYDTDEYFTKIVGSDINLHLLKQARKGIYTKTDLKSLSSDYRDRYMFPYNSNGSTYYKFRDEVKDLVSFNFINLVEPVTFKVFSMDIIFCQNVLFYFSKKVRLEIINKLCEYLVKGGYLILGPSDIVTEQIQGMRAVYINDSLVYRKI